MPAVGEKQQDAPQLVEQMSGRSRDLGTRSKKEETRRGRGRAARGEHQRSGTPHSIILAAQQAAWHAPTHPCTHPQPCPLSQTPALYLLTLLVLAGRLHWLYTQPLTPPQAATGPSLHTGPSIRAGSSNNTGYSNTTTTVIPHAPMSSYLWGRCMLRKNRSVICGGRRQTG